VKVSVKIGSKVKSTEVNSSNTIHQLKVQLGADKLTRLYPDRIRLTIPGPEGKPVVLSDDKTLSSYAINEKTEIILKDLGPQVGYKTVFIVEYLGPLVLYPLFTLPLVREFIYGSAKPYNPNFVQTLALACWIFHYVKRELETLFVHKFSHGTMPITNIFKNSIYYWGAGAFVSYFVNHPLYTAPDLKQVYAAAGAFFFFELVNLLTHVELSSLRPAGSKEYGLPRGLLFKYITCPNYTFEILSWVAFSFLTQTAAAYGFTLLGFVQMLIWAKGKHARYVRTFPKNKEGKPAFHPRTALIFPPFL